MRCLYALCVLSFVFVVASCAPVPPPVPAPPIAVEAPVPVPTPAPAADEPNLADVNEVILPANVNDEARFCLEEPWGHQPQKTCRTIGRLREWMHSAQAE